MFKAYTAFEKATFNAERDITENAQLCVSELMRLLGALFRCIVVIAFSFH